MNSGLRAGQSIPLATGDSFIWPRTNRALDSRVVVYSNGLGWIHVQLSCSTFTGSLRTPAAGSRERVGPMQKEKRQPCHVDVKTVGGRLGASERCSLHAALWRFRGAPAKPKAPHRLPQRRPRPSRRLTPSRTASASHTPPWTAWRSATERARRASRPSPRFVGRPPPRHAPHVIELRTSHHVLTQRPRTHSP